jgi:hypothetical protein
VDDAITDIFTTVAGGLEPNSTAVVGEALHRGRRLRTRRRLAAALGVVVTGGAAVTAAALVAGTLAAGQPGHGPQALAGGSHRHHPKKQHAPKRHLPKQVYGRGMTSGQMLKVLRPMLPAGTLTYVYPPSQRGLAEVNFNDGKGSVDIMLWVYPTQLPSTTVRGWKSLPAAEKKRIEKQMALTCPHPLWTDEGPRPAGALPESCVMRTLPDGSVERDAVMYADAAGFYPYLITEQRADGITVSIQVANGTLGGTPHLTRAGWPYVDRAVPSGSMALWESVVESPKWHV